MCKECVTPTMRAKIELVQSVASDFSDGAYFAFCAEEGVDIEDLEAYFETHEKQKKKEGVK